MGCIPKRNKAFASLIEVSDALRLPNLIECLADHVTLLVRVCDKEGQISNSYMS